MNAVAQQQQALLGTLLALPGSAQAADAVTALRALVHSPWARGLARVIAPRRLAPRTRYVACLVPCYEASRLAGLGLPVADPLAEAPAWTVGVEALLPVYDHWYFTTAPARWSRRDRRSGP